MTDSLLIVNARVVDEGAVREADVLVRGERIEAIGPDLSGRQADEVVDADGRILLPGMIDDQVHFRDPGLTHKGDLVSESRAAVAGGITTVMEMPNTVPFASTAALIEEKYALAKKRCGANHSFYLGATNDNLDEVRRIDPRAVCGIKVFMGASTGNALVDNPEVLNGIFRDAPIIVATHCEDTPTIEANLAEARARLGVDVPIGEHPTIRSAEACYRSSSLAVELAREHGTRLHVLHLTTARELELFEEGPVEDKRITVEACVHHLWFCDSDYERLGSKIKCNPAIKTAADREALRDAVRRGRIDVIATDHAPHTLQEKERPYLESPAGLAYVQHALLALLDLVATGELTLELLAERAAHAPARVFDVIDRGFIREGAYADLVLADLTKPTKVLDDNILHGCGWSAFEGHTFSSSIAATWVNGRLAARDGRPVDGPAGKRLEFAR